MKQVPAAFFALVACIPLMSGCPANTCFLTVNGRCTYTNVDVSYDFESGAAGWTVETATNAGTNNWQILPDPNSASAQNHAFFTDDAVVGRSRARAELRACSFSRVRRDAR